MGRSPRVTREQVLEAARETFVEQGFAGATLAQIGSRLSVSPAALLRHAPTKEALFLAAMGRPDAEDLLPFEFLEEYRGSEDPAPILRRAGEVFVPFLEKRIRELVARWVYFKMAPEGGFRKGVRGIGRIPLPFDPSRRPSPPEKNLRFLEDYLRRAGRHGRVRVHGNDYRAAAFAFLATLHSYVFMQHVVEILAKPIPLSDYLDTVVDVWTRGIVPPVNRKNKR
ncbi:MAG TPA: helix-turn-helix domain-containing protein [Thermoanaerobaculia bacterium]|jgi:AcrR family transcriptional regulator